jgi:predicted acylesterase/phospholipase RssA
MGVKNLVVYSLPVSGGAFVSQLGLLRELFQALEICQVHANEPDIVLAASGGNAAAYIAMAGNWTYDGIARVARDFDSDHFIRSWFPKGMRFIPTIIAGIFKGSVYNMGYGCDYIFQRYFTEQSIQRTEIWTGTYNEDAVKAEFFCNKAQVNALIQNSEFAADREYVDATSLEYVGDNAPIIPRIAQICMASASIPYLVKHQLIDGAKYIDGGVMFASPTFALKRELLRLAEGRQTVIRVPHPELGVTTSGELRSARPTPLQPRHFRHYYIASYDLQATYAKNNSQMPLVDTLGQMIHSTILADRLAGFDVVRTLASGRLHKLRYYHYPLLNAHTLARLLVQLMEHTEHYSMTLYPYGQRSIKLTTFTGEDIIAALPTAKYGVKVCAVLK